MTQTIAGFSSSISEREAEFCKQHDLPTRSCSAEQRLREILTFRSSPRLYQATCAISGKRVITWIPPDSPYKVYHPKHEHELEAEKYARPYDFSRSFFEQFAELALAVPYFSRVGMFSSNENCDFCPGAAWSRNCYLCFRVMKGEDCFYSRYIRTGKDLVDCIWCVESELAYSCVNLTRCYDLAFCDHCQDCSSSRFLFNCISCRDCFCCVGLQNAQYCFENQQLSPSEYRQRLESINLDSRKSYEFWSKRKTELTPKNIPIFFLDKCEDSTGNYLVRCAGAKSSYFSFDSVDIEYCIGVEKLSSSFFSVGMGANSELAYCCEAVGNQAYDVRFSSNCMSGVQYLEYCLNVCNGAAHCFGCVGIRRGSYMILNQQYSRDEYFETRNRIIKQMRATGEYGRYFPASLSPFAFNHSEANDFLPLSKQDSIRSGFHWQEEEESTDHETVSEMPDSLREISHEMSTQKFLCVNTHKHYTIQAKELDFHKRMQIALPKVSPLERLRLRSEALKIS